MKKALPIKIREANIISLKETFISKDYKTSQEVIKGCEAALGMLFESFEILDSSVSLKESYWSPNHLCRDLADRARVIKVSFELEIDLSNIDYYLKFFSRKEFSEKIMVNTKNLARKPNPNELCWIISSNNFFDINDNIHIDLTHNKDNETYFVTFSIPLKEYPGLEDKIAKYIELLNNKKNLERKLFLLKDSFIKNDLGAALISFKSVDKGSFKITQATTSGPAHGPRPASSTPAIFFIPALIKVFSIILALRLIFD